MANRTAKSVSAIVASVLAAPLISLAGSAGAAPDDCLPGPKGATPQGQHWYYRLDRATKRQCWYLRDEGEKASPSAASESADPQSAAASQPTSSPSTLSESTPAQSAAPNAPATVSAPARRPKVAARAVEDAHAEWPAPQSGNRLETTASVAQQVPSTPVNPAAAQAGQTSPQQDAQQTMFGSRWPDSSDLPSAAPSPAPQPLADARPASKAAPRAPGATQLAPAASDAANDSSSGSIRSLLMVMLGALTLAGLIASIIYRFGARHRAGQEVRGRRQVNWDAAAQSPAPAWSEKAEKSSLAADIMALSTKALSTKPLSTKAVASRPMESRTAEPDTVSPESVSRKVLPSDLLDADMPELKDLEFEQEARISDSGNLAFNISEFDTILEPAHPAPEPKVDDSADPEIDRITALLEQLIKQGPKLDRMMPASSAADVGLTRAIPTP